MNRPALTVAAAALLAGALLAGCGSKHASDSADSPGTATAPAASATATASAASSDPLRQATAKHDQAFPDVAKACAGESAQVPTGQPSATAGTVRENPKYEENHAFQQMAGLSPLAQCRGDVHAARITAEVSKTGAPAGPDQAKQLLARLGYPQVTVQQGTEGVQFTLFVPEVGPCLTGVLSAEPRIETHGVYLEGGCETPRGGH